MEILILILIGLFLVWWIINRDGTHPTENIDNEIGDLMKEISSALSRASVIRFFDYTMQYKYKDGQNDYIAIKFIDMDSRPTKFSVPISECKTNNIKCLGNMILTENNSIYSKPYLLFGYFENNECIYKFKVYMVHSAWGWLKVITESFNKGYNSTKNWRGYDPFK